MRVFAAVAAVFMMFLAPAAAATTAATQQLRLHEAPLPFLRTPAFLRRPLALARPQQQSQQQPRRQLPSPRAAGAERITEHIAMNPPADTRHLQRAAQTFCLAIALYHEARGEPLEGQAAVAATIFNRVASRAYPDTICAVVYENARRRNACQFSFACDGRSDEPKNLRAFRRMAALSRMLMRLVDERGHLREEAAARHPLLAHYLRKYALATHYHRFDVRPRWSRRMQRIGQVGDHVFFIAERVLRRMPPRARLQRIRFQRRQLPLAAPAL